ncbi:MAG: fluoride efflux transporter CrcB [Candidatus Omnitrophica bacterium]|nr:fluoride efflux transporter CrcB [Candidatus Omnitrophota bacterium]
MKFISLIVGGALGTMARYLMSGFVYQVCGTQFPYGTLVVNLTGCLILGFLAALTGDKFILGPQAKLLLMVGFCGAFTTFSTFMFETANLIKDGETLRAFLNVIVSVVVGFIVFRVGVFLGDIL